MDDRGRMTPAFRLAAWLAVVVVLFGSVASAARADGDPGSDVLAYQNLFVGPDAGLAVRQQAEISRLLEAAGRAGMPIRVAIIATRSDLGAVTALWEKPRLYARYLGAELALAYRQRLLVVMPNGFGFNWPGHSSTAAYRRLGGISPGPSRSLVGATQGAVRALAAAAGVHLHAGGAAPAPAPAVGVSPSVTGTPPAGAGSATDSRVATVAAIVLLVLALAAGARRLLRRRGVRPARAGPPGDRAALGERISSRRAVPVLVLLLALTIATPLIAREALRSATVGSSIGALAGNPELDPGQPLAGPAPEFTLSDQVGRPVSLRAYRGKVVLLAFTDSECTTECPLTTQAMLQARAMLGAAGSHVQLLGIDANPKATSLEDVLSYSQLHGMLRAWHFLTGSLPSLRRVWRAYKVEAAIDRGLITHTPALFVIDPHGRMARVFITQQSYAAIGQLAQLLAREASRLLPGRPAVHSDLSYRSIAGIGPTRRTTLPRAGGGTVSLAPGRGARLYLFFATWNRETTGLAGQLDALDGYSATAAAAGLPRLTAVDEGSVEPSPGVLGAFLRTLRRPLGYPVAIDRSGRVADGYEVLGAPWFVLVSATGRIVYTRQVSTAGWPSRRTLVASVRTALAATPRQPVGPKAVARALAGSPAPLAALHAEASRLLGSEPALLARVRALHGYPLVVNAWASWCGPCQAEAALFGAASVQFGRQIGFLGADTSDAPGDAQAFLTQHPVSYPSYQASSTAALGALAIVPSLPTTVFISRSGRVAYVHIGQYASQGALNADIARYAQAG